MNIAILTGHFTPEIHPRAFRSFELAKELSREGNAVTVYSLSSFEDFDYTAIEKQFNIKIIHLNLYKRSCSIKKQRSKASKIVKAMTDYFLAGRLFQNAYAISRRISTSLSHFDVVISISTPFMNLYGAALCRKRKTVAGKQLYIADSGDPFYRSKQTKRAWYFYFIEKNIYKQYDYLSIPEKSAMPAYTGLLDEKKIVIIPQGFDLNSIKLPSYERNSICTFSYSGVFYMDIRNPKFLFDYLEGLDIEFIFNVYMRYEDEIITQLISSYSEKTRKKIHLFYAIQRQDLLVELSKSDFLINFENTVTTQVPSKLIDYAIVGRPILSCNSDTFSPELLDKFLQGNYEDQLIIDKNKYDIKTVTKQFLDLCEG